MYEIYDWEMLLYDLILKKILENYWKIMFS